MSDTQNGTTGDATADGGDAPGLGMTQAGSGDAAPIATSPEMPMPPEPVTNAGITPMSGPAQTAPVEAPNPTMPDLDAHESGSPFVALWEHFNARLRALEGKSAPAASDMEPTA